MTSSSFEGSLETTVSVAALWLLLNGEKSEGDDHANESKVCGKLYLMQGGAGTQTTSHSTQKSGCVTVKTRAA